MKFAELNWKNLQITISITNLKSHPRTTILELGKEVSDT